MKIKSFEFNLRELAGSMGDFGTLFPLAIGYIIVCGLNPAGFLVMMGIANIVTGLVYRLPMPIEAYEGSGCGGYRAALVPINGLCIRIRDGCYLASVRCDRCHKLDCKSNPISVIRGIQVALGVLLAIQAFKMISTWWTIGIVSILVVLVLRQNRYAPAAIVLMILGVVIIFIKGQFQQINPPSLSLPSLTVFRLEEVWQTLLLTGFAQVLLTVTNATIATSTF